MELRVALASTLSTCSTFLARVFSELCNLVLTSLNVWLARKTYASVSHTKQRRRLEKASVHLRGKLLANLGRFSSLANLRSEGSVIMERPRNPDNTKSRLLALPGELRNRIYRYALVKDGPIAFKCGNNRSGERFVPAILQVCRQIRSEAIRIYFHENTFSFFVIVSLKHPLREFSTSIGNESLQLCASVMLLGGACGMSNSHTDYHVFEIDFQVKTVKQCLTAANCDADDLNVLQPAMHKLPRILRGCDLANATDLDLEILLCQLVEALDGTGSYFL